MYGTTLRTGATPPERLRELLGVLRARGHALVLPTARFEDEDAHPLVVPIARFRRDALNYDDDDCDGTIGILLRPSTVTGAVPKTLPVVRCGPGGIDLLSLDASSHVHRALVEEDAEKRGGAAASDADAAAADDDDSGADASRTVLVPTRRLMNRAFDGDVVAVRRVLCTGSHTTAFAW